MPCAYVSPAGKDSNDGKGADSCPRLANPGDMGRGAIACGQVLIVMGGTYATDEIRMTQKCSAAAKAVVLVNPGDTATIISQPANSGARAGAGRGARGDRRPGRGICGERRIGEYDAEIGGSHNALINVEFHPPVIPSFKFGVVIGGRHNLVYRSYLHDYGSPDATQNPDGNGGFLLTLLGWRRDRECRLEQPSDARRPRREPVQVGLPLQSLAEQCDGWRMGPGMDRRVRRRAGTTTWWKAT